MARATRRHADAPINRWQIALAALVGGLLAAGIQSGGAYATGVLQWDRQSWGEGDVWAAQLTWAAWIAAVAVIFGAASGVRIGVAPGRAAGIGPRTLAVLGAALGAAVAVPWSPSRPGAAPATAGAN